MEFLKEIQNYNWILMIFKLSFILEIKLLLNFMNRQQ